jgi:hypothetical protein
MYYRICDIVFDAFLWHDLLEKNFENCFNGTTCWRRILETGNSFGASKQENAMRDKDK